MPEVVRQLNERLRTELGTNPRYAWRWSENLLHVMGVLDKDGSPVYVEGRSPDGLVTMVPKTAVRKLLPNHENCWVVCALVEVDEKDGSLEGTGNHAWIPLSSANSGPVHTYDTPTLSLTEYVIEAIRETRAKRPVDYTREAEEALSKREQDHWLNIYEQIREASTAFYNVPGKKGHVSFGGYDIPTQLVQ